MVHIVQSCTLEVLIRTVELVKLAFYIHYPPRKRGLGDGDKKVTPVIGDDWALCTRQLAPVVEKRFTASKQGWDTTA